MAHKRGIAAAVGRISSGSSAALAACLTAFLAGSVLGTVFSGMISAPDVVSEHFAHLFEAYGSGETAPVEIGAVAANTYFYHVISFLLGFSILGVVLIPATSAIRGFMLSFSMAVIIRMYSGKGVAVALAAFGITSVISVPCFLIISVLSFEASKRLFDSAVLRSSYAVSPYTGKFFLVCAACFAVLFVPVLCEMFLIPALLRAAILGV